MNTNILPEYTDEELEQNAINNLRELASSIDELITIGLSSEEIADKFRDAQYKGVKTLRNPPPRLIEPHRVSAFY